MFLVIYNTQNSNSLLIMIAEVAKRFHNLIRQDNQKKLFVLLFLKE